MLRIQIKAIKNWNGEETKYPKRSTFRAAYNQTKKLLERELDHLDIRSDSLRIEMFVRPGEIRLDGQLRADARPYKQGVKLSFDLITERTPIPGTNKDKIKIQPVTYPCDTFDDWQDNLRAIALSLQNLRAVERYGVMKFQDMVKRLALPSAEGKTSTPDAAAQILSKYSGFGVDAILSDKAVAKTAYQKAARVLHPDSPGGNQDDFIALKKAYEALK